MNNLFGLINLLILIKFEIIFNQDINKGIIKIIDNVELPIIFNANSEYLNIISSGKLYVVKKENNIIKNQKNISTYIEPYLFYIEKSNIYYLITQGSRYKVLIDNNNEISDLELEGNLPQINFYCCGSAFEKFNSQITNEFEKIGSIIYGLNSNKIYFYSTFKNIIYSLLYDFGGIINIQSLSCELIEENYYYFLCVFNLEHKLEIKIINCTKDTCVISANKDDLSNYYDGIIYNTLEMNVKFFCAKVNEQTKIDCSKIKTEDNSGIVVNNFYLLSGNYIPNNYDINNCNFIYFLSGYLFCCSCKDYIICNKFTYKFDKETEFTISFDGENSFLTLINR